MIVGDIGRNNAMAVVGDGRLDCHLPTSIIWANVKQVCALLSGGGYAEKVVVPAGQVLPIPSGISLKDAASFP
ncbi:quinone oxidoreductase PIG3, partial [Tanacetum coccineum]